MKRFLVLLFLVCALRDPLYAAESISETTLRAYYAISEALAADSLTEVSDNAKKFSAAVQDPALRISAQNVAAATQVSLEKTREMFKFLSAVLANGIKYGDYAIAEGATYRVHCPMKDADWLQAAESPIHNPYHGSEMLECGGVVATYGSKP